MDDCLTELTAWTVFVLEFQDVGRDSPFRALGGGVRFGSGL